MDIRAAVVRLGEAGVLVNNHGVGSTLRDDFYVHRVAAGKLALLPER